MALGLFKVSSVLFQMHCRGCLCMYISISLVFSYPTIAILSHHSYRLLSLGNAQGHFLHHKLIKPFMPLFVGPRFTEGRFLLDLLGSKRDKTTSVFVFTIFFFPLNAKHSSETKQTEPARTPVSEKAF